MTHERSTTTTVLFTDLINSTEVLDRAGDAQAQRVFIAHHRLLSEAVDRHGGEEVKWLGDGLMVAFDSAVDAVRCAIEVQRASRRPIDGERLQIRVGLHLGEALRHNETDLFGRSVVVARRLCDGADPGQIITSALVRDLLRGRDEFEFRSVGERTLKGFKQPVEACEVLYEHDLLALASRTPFIGRTSEVATLRARFDDALAGRGTVVMLAGEPGIGKTRTATEFAEFIAGAGAAVLMGSCVEGEWSPPFAPFASAIAGYVMSGDPSAASAAVGVNAGVLSRIVPSLRNIFPAADEPPPIEPDGERFRLLQAMSDTLVAISREAPLLLILDDLHWADAGTVAMLRHVVRHAAAQRIMILGAYRNVEIDRQHPLSAALGDLRRETSFERIVLRGLGDRDVAELLDVVADHEVPAPLIEAISNETGGNPFFIREVLLHLVEEGKIRGESTADDPEIGIPEGVRDVIGRRLSRLSPECNNILQAASALRGGFSFEMLRAAADAAEVDALDAIDESLAAQVIVERSRDAYDFTHALVRHTLYDELNTPRRIRLHRRIGQGIEQLAGDDPGYSAEIAHHLLLGEPGGDLRHTVESVVRASRRAVALASYDEAVGLCQRARGLAEADPSFDPTLLCELLILLAEALLCAGSNERSMEVLDAVFPIARQTGVADQFARATIGYETARFAMAPVLRGSMREVVQGLFEEALERIGPSDSKLRARLLARFAWSLTTRERDWRAELVTEALAIGGRLADQPTQLYVLFARQQSFWQGPETRDDRLRSASEIVHVAEAAGVKEQALLGHYALMHASLERGDIEVVDDELAKFEALARELRRPQYLSWSALFRGMRELMRGEFDAAERLAHEALSLEPDGGERSLALSMFGAQLFAIRREQGRLAEMKDLMVRFAESNRAVQWSAAVADMYAEIGDHDAARLELQRFVGDSFSGVERDSNWLMALTLCSEAAVIIHDVERAKVLYQLMLPFADHVVVVGHAPACAGSCERYLGQLAGTLGRCDDAVAHFERALAMNERIASPPWTAHAAADCALALRKRSAPGDVDRAAALLATATDIAGRLGMVALQRKLGVT